MCPVSLQCLSYRSPGQSYESEFTMISDTDNKESIVLYCVVLCSIVGPQATHRRVQGPECQLCDLLHEGRPKTGAP